MALASLLSRGQAGLNAYLVTVEVHLAGGLPGFTVIGLPAGAVRESKDRVRAALEKPRVRIHQDVVLSSSMLVEPGDTMALATALHQLMNDTNQRNELGRAGREVVHRHFHAERMARETLAVYARFVRK